METESLDTNILLRFVLGDNKAQRHIAVKLISKHDTSYEVADIAISEMAYVLETTMKYPRTFVTASINQILSQPNIHCNHPLFHEVLPFYETHPALSFNDCCLSTQAALNQSEPLWTFDRKLATQSPTAKQAQ